jgi:hypothetical protein
MAGMNKNAASNLAALIQSAAAVSAFSLLPSPFCLLLTALA